jgi:hypothetical protein
MKTEADHHPERGPASWHQPVTRTVDLLGAGPSQPTRRVALERDPSCGHAAARGGGLRAASTAACERPTTAANEAQLAHRGRPVQ